MGAEVKHKANMDSRGNIESKLKMRKYRTNYRQEESCANHELSRPSLYESVRMKACMNHELSGISMYEP